jgi:putative aminopeptidase FrvX
MQNLKLLYSLYNIHSPSGNEDKMIAFLSYILKKQSLEFTTDKCGNIYVTKGVADTYPCIVAHMDK